MLAWSGDYLQASRGYHLTRARIQDPSNNLTWQPVAVYRPSLRRRAFEAGASSVGCSSHSFRWNRTALSNAPNASSVWSPALSLITSTNRRYGTLAAQRLYSARALQLDINLLTATFPIAPMPSTARSLTPHKSSPYPPWTVHDFRPSWVVEQVISPKPNPASTHLFFHSRNQSRYFLAFHDLVTLRHLRKRGLSNHVRQDPLWRDFQGSQFCPLTVRHFLRAM